MGIIEVGGPLRDGISFFVHLRGKVKIPPENGTVNFEVIHIASSHGAFAALTAQGNVATWRSPM